MLRPYGTRATVSQLLLWDDDDDQPDGARP
jgi:hypothetical protein